MDTSVAFTPYKFLNELSDPIFDSQGVSNLKSSIEIINKPSMC